MILKPQVYHGRKKKPPYFEGWYFKIIDQKGQNRLAIIPGIYKAVVSEDSHAFIQVLDGSSGNSYYFDFPIRAFSASDKELHVRINDNVFHQNGFELDLKNNDLVLEGKVIFDRLTPWPVTILSPGIMGWYAYVPFMQCYHGIVSMDHGLQGRLYFHDRLIDFQGGKGYIEKDWGRAFPEAYIWCQSNHFEREKTSLSASLAIIPWLYKAFPGFICGFLLEGTLYRFATYTGAKIKHLQVNDDRLEWMIRHRSLGLEMDISKSRAGILRAPGTLSMDRRISETMTGEVKVRLTDKNTVLFEGTGHHASVESAGNLDKLLTMWEKNK